MGCCASAAVDPGSKDDVEDPPPTRVAPPAPPAPAPAASAAAGPAAADSTTSSAVLAAPPAMKRLDTVEALEAQIAAEQSARLQREITERRARILRDASPPPSMSASQSWSRPRFRSPSPPPSPPSPPSPPLSALSGGLPAGAGAVPALVMLGLLAAGLAAGGVWLLRNRTCLLYTSPSPRDVEVEGIA